MQKTVLNLMQLMWKKRMATLSYSFLILLYLLAAKYSLFWLMLPLGAILWGFLPGCLLNEFLGLHRVIGNISRIGFGIVSSIIVINLPLLLCKTVIPFEAKSQIVAVLLINTILFIVLLISDKLPKINLEGDQYCFVLARLPEALLSLLPFVFFLIRSTINPFLIDQDGSIYITIMKAVEQTHVDNSILSSIRAAFTHIVMSAHYLTGLSFLNLFKFFLPGLCWLAFTIVFAVGRIKTKKRILLVVLGSLVLISPSLAGQIDRFKPETIILVMTLATAALYATFVQTGRIVFYFLGLTYVLLSFRTHDTGAILLVIYLASGLGWILLNYQYLRKYLTVKNIILGAFIVFPYYFLLNINHIVSNLSYVVKNEFPSQGVKFTLWFLSGYTSVGMSTGWPGVTFVLFYIFNGILILPLVLYALARIKKSPHRTEYYTISLPLLIGMAIYFFIAEILPRAGYFFLPDRAWNHFFLYSVIFVLFSIFNFKDVFPNKSLRLLKTLLIANIVGGFIVSCLMVLMAGSSVSKGELGVIKKMSQGIEANAVIVSPQTYNDVMIANYVGKRFYAIPGNLSQTNTTVLELKENILSSNSFTDTSGDTVAHVLAETTTRFDSNGVVVDKSQQVIKTWQDQVSPATDSDSSNPPVYLLYSLSKTNGLLAKLNRQTWTVGLDLADKNFFENLPDNETVHKDKDAVLLKIR